MNKKSNISQLIIDFKQNPPWVNIAWGIFLPIIVLTIFGLVFEGWYAIFVPLAPILLMTFGIYLLFDYPELAFPELFAPILIAKILWIFSWLILIIGWRYKGKLWGQAFVIVGFWMWNIVGMYGLALHG